MSSSANGSGSFPRLGPSWYRGNGTQAGKGFQPPPAAERRRRSGSYASQDSDHKLGKSNNNSNKFSALDDEEYDDDPPKDTGSSKSKLLFRSSSLGHKGPVGQSGKGRSLADLAAQVPETPHGRSQSMGSSRFIRSDSSVDGKVIRFTREKLLALRPASSPFDGIPDILRHLEGIPIISHDPLDPVCWDSFDADAIWEQTARERSTGRSSMLIPKASVGLRGPGEGLPDERRKSAGPTTGKWERGVALPPAGESEHRQGGRRQEPESPDDLWDDPLGGDDAAADFSAFGTIPDDPKDTGKEGKAESFDFEKMAETSSKFGKLLRGEISDGKLRNSPTESGSGDIDHEQPVTPEITASQTGTVSSGDDDEKQSATSRLMQMIGVKQESEGGLDEHIVGTTNTSTENTINPWAVDSEEIKDDTRPTVKSAELSVNPWGKPVEPTTNESQQQEVGFDLAARLGVITTGASVKELAEENLLRQRQEEEAKQRATQAERVAFVQKQADEHARQVAVQQQQDQRGYSQVELILMERISLILEQSWGRADLVTILSTLHTEDARVIPLLGNTDALRALLLRHPRRVAIRPDPGFGVDMAILLLTQSQFQQQSAPVHSREQDRFTQSAQRDNARLRRTVADDAPWFYSDPQKNIQGPFRSEEMRQWLEAGYFKGDLPISQEASGPFLPLSAIFPDLSVAFKPSSPEILHPSDSDAVTGSSTNHGETVSLGVVSNQQVPPTSTEEPVVEVKEQQDPEQRHVVGQYAQSANRPVRAESPVPTGLRLSQGGNANSAKLKMMLGLSGQTEQHLAVQETAGKNPNGQAEPGVEEGSIGADVPVELVRVEQASVHSEKYGRPRPVANQETTRTAWGTLNAGAPLRKSMSEIQQEEAQASAALERDGSRRGSGGGWANIAASGGSTAWANGAAKPSGPHSTSASAPASHRQVIKPHFTTRQPTGPSTSSSLSSSVSSSLKPGTESRTKPGDEFGTSMPPALESWCKEQMKAMKGNEDLTLIAFCMTLTDPSEIRQYLNAYLGTSSEVSTFASEFINRRGLAKQKQERWESTKPKRGRKKTTK